MRRTIQGLAVLLLCAWAAPALAQVPQSTLTQSTEQNIIIGEALSYEAVTVTTASKALTAALISPADWRTRGNATRALISIETATTNICFDGTPASASACHAIPAGTILYVYGTKTLQLMRFYSAGSTVKVTYFRFRGK